MRGLTGNLPRTTRQRLRHARRSTALLMNRVGLRWRPLPDFVIIGAQKAGTTSLAKYLAQSPDVRPALRKEIHFFDVHYGKGAAWYRCHFPTRKPGDSWKAGDASPLYLFHPHAPARAAGLIPDAKIICLLRDPVARAWSHWRHEVALGNETLGFEDAIAAEEERTASAWARLEEDPYFQSQAIRSFTYFRRGVYLPQLRRWHEHFPPDRVMIVDSARLSAEPERTTGEVADFIGIRGPEPGADFGRENVGKRAELPTSTARHLADRYRRANLELFEYLGRRFDWRGVEDDTS